MRAHLDDFVCGYHPENRSKRRESERFHVFAVEEVLRREKASLDLSWLREEGIDDTDDLPPPGVIVSEIIEDLTNAIILLQEML